MMNAGGGIEFSCFMLVASRSHDLVIVAPQRCDCLVIGNAILLAMWSRNYDHIDIDVIKK